jgi:hypothetical protein
MTPQQAYDILKEVAEKYKGTFQDHCAMQTALRVIARLIDPPKIEGQEEVANADQA